MCGDGTGRDPALEFFERPSSMEPPRSSHSDMSNPWGETDIAVIGMSGRFPGAPDVDTFWRNVSTGVESFTQFSDEDLALAGVDAELAHSPGYVRCRPILENIRGFDAAFFGYSPQEATVADPQQRLFLECAWEALEAAGYAVPERRGTVGVFAGMNISTYLLSRGNALQGDLGVDTFALMIGNDKDALTTNVSFRLDLTGPSVAVQTFCSTSLVAVHLACQTLRRGECDLALAGGVSVRVPDRVGYVYQEGGQESPDGHVRTFDADARGSMFGDGASVVALKRLDRAMADRDTVLAVVRGSAVNNDGALKFGFLAPSVAGQRRCVADALAAAAVEPSGISYVEAHGTATEVGDPMEVAALTGAFGAVGATGYCVLGSVKPNIGHLDRASGVTGLIKVVQSLRHELIPGTLHFRTPNPEIDFDSSPFHVTAEPTPWPRRAGHPRIAGLNSLGMGGTNAHAIVAEAPEPASRPERPARWQILPVSARSAQAAEQACARLADRLDVAPDLDLGDVAYTLQVGRRVFDHRRVVVADSPGTASRMLTGAATGALLSRVDPTVGRKVGYLIAGVGEQYPGMVAALYTDDATYRADVDACLAVLGLDDPARLSDMFTAVDRPAGAPGDLARALGRRSDPPTRPVAEPHLVQPAAFVAEYALARLLMRWGVRPDVMVGYSLGEYVAACLSGVLSLPDALRLVAHRAALIASLPAGAMLAVAADEERLRAVLGDLSTRDLDVAVRTGSQLVLAGPPDAVDAAAGLLLAAEIGCRRLDTTHAFHSRMLAPAAAELTAWITDHVTLHPPTIPYVSNVTGRPVTADLVTDPGYWARHLCETVEFGGGLAHVLGLGDLALAEIGAGQSLGALARAHPACTPRQWPLVVPTLPAASDHRAAPVALAEAVGRLWLTGVPVDWATLHGMPDTPGNPPASHAGWLPGRVPLPTYPFQRQDYWLDVEPTRPAAGSGAPAVDDDPTSLLSALPRLPESRWVNLPVWRQAAPTPVRADPARWLVYTDAGLADALTAPLRAELEAAGHRVTLVRPGARFSSGPDGLVVRPGSSDDASAALQELKGRGCLPDRVVHLWTADAGAPQPAGGNGAHPPHGGNGGRPLDGDPVRNCLQRGTHTLVALARAAGELGLPPWSLEIVTVASHGVLPGDPVRPERATLLGPCRVIPVEYPGVTTRLIDIDPATATTGAAPLLAELCSLPTDPVVALRGGRRWVPDFDVLDVSHTPGHGVALRPGGAYLVTGGLGGIGLAMAERLAEHHQARVLLLCRTPVPARDEWDRILAAPGTADEVRRRLDGLRRLEASGAEVVTVAGDVSRVDDVRRAVATALERFGRLDGVLHCAGVPAAGLMQFKTVTERERVLAPKIAGTLALADVLADVPVDFLALFSSVGSSTGNGPGQVDYCAASAFLDAFARSDPLPGRAVVSIGWGKWAWSGWSGALDGHDPTVRAFLESHRATFGITFDEGWRAFGRALASGEPHLAVSTQDLPTLVAQGRRSSIENLRVAARKARGGAARRPRPQVSTPYVAPRTPAEEAVAEVWADALGLDRVGVHDDFFDLGGNSLIGVDVVGRVRRALNLPRLSPHLLYQAPTVGALAATASPGEPGERPRDPDRTRQQSRIEQRRNTLRTGRSS